MPIFHRITDTYFTTATILNWQNLLEEDAYKEIIVEALSYLSEKGLMRVYAFVIMPNHMHLVWIVTGACSLSRLKHTLNSYTAHRFLHKLRSDDDKRLYDYMVNKSDRRYQFWQRRPMDIPTVSEPFLLQKINYIHQNPVRAGLATDAGDYKYSSTGSYRRGIPEWSFLTLCEVDFI